MNVQEITNNIMNLFPAGKGETEKEYTFWLENAIGYLRGEIDYDKAWEAIKLYEGSTKKPKLSFFKYVAGKSADHTGGLTHYYKCERCGSVLSEGSQGGCPLCHGTKAHSFYKSQPVNAIVCQSGCFDCTVYNDKVLCASCEDFGTYKYNDCDFKRDCPGRACCKYEYMRRFHPQELRKVLDVAIHSLPESISEVGKAFRDGRAEVKDIIRFLKSKDQ